MTEKLMRNPLHGLYSPLHYKDYPICCGYGWNSLKYTKIYRKDELSTSLRTTHLYNSISGELDEISAELDPMKISFPDNADGVAIYREDSKTSLYIIPENIMISCDDYCQDFECCDYHSGFVAISGDNKITIFRVNSQHDMFGISYDMFGISYDIPEIYRMFLWVDSDFSAINSDAKHVSPITLYYISGDIGLIAVDIQSGYSRVIIRGKIDQLFVERINGVVCLYSETFDRGNVSRENIYYDMKSRRVLFRGKHTYIYCITNKRVYTTYGLYLSDITGGITKSIKLMKPVMEATAITHGLVRLQNLSGIAGLFYDLCTGKYYYSDCPHFVPRIGDGKFLQECYKNDEKYLIRFYVPNRFRWDRGYFRFLPENHRNVILLMVLIRKYRPESAVSTIPFDILMQILDEYSDSAE